MNKKILFAIAASAVLLLAAGQALAVAYAPGTGASQTQGVSVQPTGMIQATAQSTWPQTVTTSGGQNVMYRTLSGGQIAPMMLASYSGRDEIFYGLIFVITTVLVWIVLIQLIFVLYHWLKKHKHT
jgi:hypothetical protein